MEVCGLPPLNMTKGWILNNDHSIVSNFYNISQNAGIYQRDHEKV